jgi:signal transduction histidine kinase
MTAIVPARAGRDHRATGHICLGLPAEPSPALPADAPSAPELYRGLVVSSAVRSFWAEPPAPNPPVRVWRDWVLIAMVATSAVLETIFREDAVWRPAGLVVSVALALALLWRRTHPLLVTAVAFGGHMLFDLASRLDTGESAALFASAYVLLLPYALLRWGSGRQATIGMAIVLVSHVATEVAASNAVDALIGPPFLLLPAALGASVRYRASSRLRETDQVKLREREQLARELHDTVAHHVSAIAIRAQAGRTLAASRPDAAVDALEVIEEAASRTLADLRALVGALRQGEEPDLAPQRVVADIPRLAHGAGDGPRVDVELAGDLEGLRPLVGAAIYRIAQESITNAVRHARHATRVDVRVTGDDDCVRLSVRDDGDAGPSGAGSSSGYGLVGMAERAALLGGTLEAGPSAGSGWTVTAVLPRNGTGT